jgi:membrane protein implicated in regulation of membrane protease activity
MVIWEVIEYANGIREKPENRLMDLIVGLLGVYLATSMASAVSTPTEQAAFFAVTPLTIIACFFGWRAYRRRSKVTQA